jgi:hypothetical protein
MAEPANREGSRCAGRCLSHLVRERVMLVTPAVTMSVSSRTVAGGSLWRPYRCRFILERSTCRNPAD